MALKTTVLLVCLLSMFHNGNLQRYREKQGDSLFRNQVTTCCQSGVYLVGTQRKPNCDLISQRSAALNSKVPGLICSIAAKVCCIKQIQEVMCNQGTQLAKQGKSCNAYAYAGSEDYSECCRCCYLGMEAKRKGMSCQSVVMGFPCYKTFRKCCLSSDPIPSPFPLVLPTATLIPITRRKTCNDLDCSQTCALLDNSPTCVCENGYELQADGRTCQDVNECNKPGTCKQGEKCKNTIGSYRCNRIPDLKCPTGYKLEKTGDFKLDCRDVDECQQNVCSDDEECENLNGSYQCKAKCPSGYAWKNGRCSRPTCQRGYRWAGSKCEDVDECNQKPCKDNEECRNRPGTYRCVRKCRRSYRFVNGKCEGICRPGYRWNGRGCEDIDECATSNGRCSAGQECQNTRGSYRCVAKCSSGYERKGSSCQDIDECATSNGRCSAGQECQNTRGSYRCVAKCSSGYERKGSGCQDVDECKQKPCKNDEVCENRPGTYRCNKKCQRGYRFVNGKCQEICQPGYRWTGRRCEDIDECTTSRRRCSSDQECQNTKGSYRCVARCSSGYERQGSDCQDIDECKNNPCGADEDCQNRPGTYRCVKRTSCSRGYRPVNGRCRDIDECAYSNTCRNNQICRNTAGSYTCENRRCLNGYEIGSSGRCQDVDECVKGTHNCKADAERCLNYPGSFSCNCNRGYSYDSRYRHCTDINECDRGVCQQKCVNTPGSYKCECQKGYTLAGTRSCYDVDECRRNPRLCDHECENTRGSYKCRCKPGFSLHTDGRTCRDIDECSRAGKKLCTWRCVNTVGSYRCECPRGYEIYYGRNCINIDECSKNGRLCGRDAECIDTSGGYKCVKSACPSKYFFKRTNTHCARQQCNWDDTACRNEKRVSMRWYGQGFPNKAGAGAFRFMYRITVPERPVRPEIRYTIETGNEERLFEVKNEGYGKCLVTNVRKLKGPRSHVLKLVGEVRSNGKLDSSFVVYLNVFVSKYDF